MNFCWFFWGDLTTIGLYSHEYMYMYMYDNIIFHNLKEKNTWTEWRHKTKELITPCDVFLRYNAHSKGWIWVDVHYIPVIPKTFVNWTWNLLLQNGDKHTNMCDFHLGVKCTWNINNYRWKSEMVMKLSRCCNTMLRHIVLILIHRNGSKFHPPPLFPPSKS